MNPQRRFSLLIDACRFGNTAAVKVYATKENVNITYDDFMQRDVTAWYSAISGEENVLEILSHLVEIGASVKLKLDGTTILEYACARNHTDVAKYLLEKGCDPNESSIANSDCYS